MTGRLETRDGTILIVCTGNVCRSPYIERLLTARLTATDITVSSAGTGALVGSDMEPEVARRLAAVGADFAGFSARQLTEGSASAADLVLCATREHRAQVVRMAPRLLRRTYALADFSDLAARLVFGDIERHATAGSFVRTVSAAAERVRGDVQPRTAESAQIVDPFRRSERVFEHMFTQVEHLLPPIIAVMTGSAPERIFATE